MHHAADVGPQFGDGVDLNISPGAGSTSHIGFTYQCPGGKSVNSYGSETFREGFGTDHCKAYLQGDTAASFTIDDWEVFVISRP